MYSKTWGAIIATQEFKLHHTLREHLALNITRDAALFLRMSLSSLANSAGESIPNLAVFSKFCDDVYEMPRDDVIKRVCRLFLLRTVGEIAFHVCGSKWSNEKSEVLKKAIIRNHDEDIYKSIQPSIRIAGRLAFICQLFGNGCLLHNPEIPTTTSI